MTWNTGRVWVFPVLIPRMMLPSERCPLTAFSSRGEIPFLLMFTIYRKSPKQQDLTAVTFRETTLAARVKYENKTTGVTYKPQTVQPGLFANTRSR
jgi:hypothetical protein